MYRKTNDSKYLSIPHHISSIPPPALIQAVKQRDAINCVMIINSYRSGNKTTAIGAATGQQNHPLSQGSHYGNFSVISTSFDGEKGSKPARQPLPPDALSSSLPPQPFLTSLDRGSFFYV
jgi:hypothetical protein